VKSLVLAIKRRMDERYTIATGISQRRADPSIKLLVTPIFPRNPFWRLVGTTHRLIQKIFVDVDSLAATARPQPIQEVEAVPTSSERDGLLLLDLQEEGVRDRLRVRERVGVAHPRRGKKGARKQEGDSISCLGSVLWSF